MRFQTYRTDSDSLSYFPPIKSQDLLNVVITSRVVAFHHVHCDNRKPDNVAIDVAVEPLYSYSSSIVCMWHLHLVAVKQQINLGFI